LKIFILRHGDAEPPDPDIADESRQLSQKGILEVKKISNWMMSHQYLPELIISSPFMRTLQTAEIVKKHLQLEEEIKLDSSLIYGTDPSLIHATLSSLDVDSVLLCSHMPLVSQMAQFFAPSTMNEGFRTPEIVKIKYDFINQHGIVTANITPQNL